MKIRAPGEVRVLDSDGFKRRAACVCLRDAIVKNNNPAASTLHQQQQQKEVLLISSAKKQDKWLVPGGGVDPGEEVATAAAREAFEEAGVRGRLDGFLGVFETATGTLTRTHVFKLEVEEEVVDGWAESNVRIRKWFPLEEAMTALHKPEHKDYLETYASQPKTQWHHRVNGDESNGRNSSQEGEGQLPPNKDLQFHVTSTHSSVAQR